MSGSRPYLATIHTLTALMRRVWSQGVLRLTTDWVLSRVLCVTRRGRSPRLRRRAVRRRMRAASTRTEASQGLTLVVHFHTSAPMDSCETRLGTLLCLTLTKILSL